MLTESSLYFTRSTRREGWLSWPVTTFVLSRGPEGAEIGRLSLHRNKAEYVSADGRDDFRIRSRFWGMKWRYEGDAEQLFIKISIGFRHTATFADGQRYRMRVKRKWRIFTPKAGDDYTHLALFFRDETEVMRLKNQGKIPLLSSEVSAPMSGPLSTELSDARTIAGLLLLFQTYLVATRQAAAAG